MKSDINLLLKTKTEVAKKLKLSGLLKIISITSVVVIVLLALSLYILSRLLSLEPIKEKQNAVISNINLLKNKQAKLIIVRNKLDNAAQIITKRPKFDSDIRTVIAKVPSEVSSQSLNLDKQKLTFNVASNSLKQINDFINNFTEMARSKNLIQDLTLGGVNFDPKSGSYSINIEGSML